MGIIPFIHRPISDKVCQCPWRLLVEEVIENNLYTLLAGFYNDLDGIKTGSSNLEEIIESTYLFNAKNLGKDTGKELFRLSFGSHKVDAAFQFGQGKHLTVDLPVGCHRHCVKMHKGIGYHIFSQRRSGKGGSDVIITNE